MFLAESMLHDLGAINVHGALCLKPFCLGETVRFCEGNKEFKNNTLNTTSNQRLGLRSPPVIIVVSC